ncbi:MAG TPA: hypothetical protein VNO69_03640 [Methyloceanibacter sp.]|nr:hypothetical protein [Methyloceanibacter sp.]
MQIAWFYRSGIAVAAVTVLLVGTSLQAAESAGASAELDKRTKPAAVPDSQSGGLSDSAVRVLMTYAFSIIPGEVRAPDGQQIKVDKSNPNKFLIPIDDARRVIRAATRSAYAEICQLPDLKQSNYQTLMRGEEARKVWTQDQILMIEALHTFSASYFAGGLKLTVTEVDEDPAGPASRATAVSKSDVPAEAPEPSGAETEIIAAPTPKCPPEQKQRVTDAINAYVQAAQAAQAPAPKPAE